jgi:hypothetical protein
MRRTAFDLDFLISRQPRQGIAAKPRLRSVTPAQNELEYLDVFDFFNVPRVNYAGEHTAGLHSHLGPDTNGDRAVDGIGSRERSGGNGNGNGSGHLVNEFNITNFMVDANSDWLFKHEHPRKYLV